MTILVLNDPYNTLRAPKHEYWWPFFDPYFFQNEYWKPLTGQEKEMGIVAIPGTAGFVILATDLWRRVVRNQLALLVATVLTAGVVPTVHRWGRCMTIFRYWKKRVNIKYVTPLTNSTMRVSLSMESPWLKQLSFSVMSWLNPFRILVSSCQTKWHLSWH